MTDVSETVNWILDIHQSGKFTFSFEWEVHPESYMTSDAITSGARYLLGLSNSLRAGEPSQGGTRHSLVGAYACALKTVGVQVPHWGASFMISDAVVNTETRDRLLSIACAPVEGALSLTIKDFVS